MFTEEEAKKKMCCNLSLHENAWGKLTVDTGNTCLTSNCMAWRWLPGDYTDEKIMGADGMWTYKRADPDKGYCGLAGKP